MKIKANGISINYHVDGPDSAPWLVLSNSLATNLSTWDDQARELGRAFRVLRYDQRGHGATEAPAGRYTFELLIADALALMDALAIKKAHFGGLSMGGATALGLAQQHPDRLDRVIVCDSPCQSTPTSSQQWKERIVVAQKQGMEALVEPTLARWFPPEVMKANPPHLDKVRQMIRTTPVNGFIGCAAALADHNYAAAVATLTRPVLFMVGEKDAAAPPMRKLNEALPASRYVELAGAGHISNLDQPEAFTRPIKDFLAAKCEPCSPGMPLRRLQSFREELYVRADPGSGAAESFRSVGLYHARHTTRTSQQIARRKRHDRRRSRHAEEASSALQQGARDDGSHQRRRRQAPRLGSHPGECPGPASVVQRDGRRRQRTARLGPRRRQPDEDDSLHVALERVQPLSASHPRYCAQGRSVADRVRGPAEPSSAQSRIDRQSAGHQHHPLRDLDLQSWRRCARPSALAQRQPHDPVGQGRLHRRRGRTLHRRARRLDPDAERHLARPRQRLGRAGDLDRHAGLAADGVPGRRVGRSRHAGCARQRQGPGRDAQRGPLAPALRPRRHKARLRRSPD